MSFFLQFIYTRLYICIQMSHKSVLLLRGQDIEKKKVLREVFIAELTERRNSMVAEGPGASRKRRCDFGAGAAAFGAWEVFRFFVFCVCACVLYYHYSPTAESFGVSAQFHQSSTRVPPELHQGSTRVPRGFCEGCEVRALKRALHAVGDIT